MTRVLVLGARGFLGAHVAAAARAHHAVGAVLTPTRHELDLDDGVEAVGAALRRTVPDVVILCTGRLDGTITALTAAHAGAVAVLVEAIAGLTDHPVRLVRLGSAGEYGPVNWGDAVREDDPTWPVTAYGASHLAATHLLRVAVMGGALSGSTLRVFNPVGAGAHGPSLASQVAVRIRRAQLEGKREISTAPLTTWRDIVDADDVARAALAAALVPGPLPPIINIGSGRAVSSREVVETLADVAGWTGQIREDGPAPDRSAGVDWMQADTRLAQRALHWHPRRSLTDSLRDVWEGGDHHHRIPLLTKDAS